MMQTMTPGGRPVTPSLYSLIELEATAASDRDLARLLALGLLLAELFLVIDLAFWPPAALAAAMAAIAAWGLLAHRAARRPEAWVAGVQRLVLLAGTLLAVVGLGAMFIWLLGPRWNL